MSFSQVAHFLFGLSHINSYQLFVPHGSRSVSPYLPKCNQNAKPKEVAAMLEKFIELVKAGEIEGETLETK